MSEPYDIRIEKAEVSEAVLARGHSFKFSYRVTPRVAKILHISQFGELEAVVDRCDSNDRFNTTRDVRVFLPKLGVIARGTVVLKSGKGWLFGTSLPKKHRD